ncbi:hypothetical protein WJX75_009671 [Coccomyxa subellipsoidea]|uniref:JmjC domain-containing protein n=1 Tax=Coccomyxa subellipsoidea TaxID=248742 RepID=A0ABR2Z613_9CHLO
MKVQDQTDEPWQEGRAMRPRPKDVAYQECEVDEAPAAPRVPYEELSRLLTHGSFAHLSAATPAGDLTADLLRSTGFQDPILVKPCENIAVTHEKLGMRAPAGLDAAAVAEKAGAELLVPTIDVETQESGPRMTLGQWADYFAQPPSGVPSGRRRRQPLLNVVSLSLAGTHLQDEVQAPMAVRAVDLVDTVWPSTEEPRPEVLLYALMSPAGAYTDFHVDFGGSSVWYHVISGRKTFLLVPPTPPNLAAFEAWASSEKQAGRFFGHEVEGALLAELGPGDTMLIPGSWPHAVVTLEDSVVVGGNFLHALDLRRAVDTWDMETRLGQERRPSVSAWEMSGLAAVLSLLRRSLRMVARFGPSVCPASITDPAGMLQELDAAISQRLPGGLSLQVSDYFMDLDPLDDSFLLGEGLVPEGILLDEDDGLLGLGLTAAEAAFQHDYQMLNSKTASLQQQRGLLRASPETHTISDEDAESEEERLGELEDSESDWLVKRKPAPAGGDVVMRSAPDEALLVKLGSPRERLGPGGRWALQSAAYALLDDDQPEKQQSQRDEEKYSAEEEAQNEAQLYVSHLRARLQKELALQGRLAAGQVRLKDGGERLRASVAAAAADLAAGLHALEATGKVETPWAHTAFERSTLSFIDAEGRTQGPFSLEHLKLLAEDDIINPDSVVLHAVHGPSLLRSVLAMPAAQGHTNGVQQAAPGNSLPAASHRSCLQTSVETHEDGEARGIASTSGPHRHDPRGEAERAHSGAAAGFSGRTSSNGWHGGSDRHRRGRFPDSPWRHHRHSTSPDGRARDRAAAAEAVRKRRAEAAAARSAQARSREAERQAETAAKWARLRQSRAMRSLQQEALAHALEAEAALEGSWTYLGKNGKEEGPFTRTELLSLHRSGQLLATTMVHDEDEGASVQLPPAATAAAAREPSTTTNCSGGGPLTSCG